MQTSTSRSSTTLTEEAKTDSFFFTEAQLVEKIYSFPSIIDDFLVFLLRSGHIETLGSLRRALIPVLPTTPADLTAEAFMASQPKEKLVNKAENEIANTHPYLKRKLPVEKFKPKLDVLFHHAYTQLKNEVVTLTKFLPSNEEDAIQFTVDIILAAFLTSNQVMLDGWINSNKLKVKVIEKLIFIVRETNSPLVLNAAREAATTWKIATPPIELSATTVDLAAIHKIKAGCATRIQRYKKESLEILEQVYRAALECREDLLPLTYTLSQLITQNHMTAFLTVHFMQIYFIATYIGFSTDELSLFLNNLKREPAQERLKKLALFCMHAHLPVEAQRINSLIEKSNNSDAHILRIISIAPKQFHALPLSMALHTKAKEIKENELKGKESNEAFVQTLTEVTAAFEQIGNPPHSILPLLDKLNSLEFTEKHRIAAIYLTAGLKLLFQPEHILNVTPTRTKQTTSAMVRILATPDTQDEQKKLPSDIKSPTLDNKLESTSTKLPDNFFFTKTELTEHCYAMIGNFKLRELLHSILRSGHVREWFMLYRKLHTQTSLFSPEDHIREKTIRSLNKKLSAIELDILQTHPHLKQKLPQEQFMKKVRLFLEFFIQPLRQKFILNLKNPSHS